MVRVRLVFQETTPLCSKVAAPFDFCAMSGEREILLPHILPALAAGSVLGFGRANRPAMLSHCCPDLHLPGGLQGGAPLPCACLPSARLVEGLQDFWPSFWPGCLFSHCLVLRVLCIFWINLYHVCKYSLQVSLDTSLHRAELFISFIYCFGRTSSTMLGRTDEGEIPTL